MRARLSWDRVGDETLPLVRSRGMRACLSWDRVEMNPASREIEPRPIVFPAPFRQGSSVQLRVLQRLGSSVRGNASFGTVAGISEPVWKLSLSQWIVDAITEAYTTQGLEIPSVHWGLSFHLAWLRCMCIQDIACQPVVFAEYLRQVLQAGRSVLSLLRAVGE